VRNKRRIKGKVRETLGLCLLIIERDEALLLLLSESGSGKGERMELEKTDTW